MLCRDSAVLDATFGDHAIFRGVKPYVCESVGGCFINLIVEIQRSVCVGRRCRIRSHAFIRESPTVDDDCISSHGAMFSDDPVATGGPARGRRELRRPDTMSNRVDIGITGRSVSVGISDPVVVSAGAVVTRDLDRPVSPFGDPARFLRRHSS